MEAAPAPAPAAAPAAAAPIIKVTAEQLGVLASDGFQGQLDTDLGHLTAWDPAPIDAAAYAGADREDVCAEAARAMAQSLVGQLFALPGEAVKGGRLAQLPAPKTPLPRERPLPKPKPPTKWEKFAAQKGIQKKSKRSKVEWDEGSQTWRRRHGYQRANDEAAVPIIEARPGDKPGEDPFTKMSEDKRKRVANNKKAQLGNARDADAQGQLPPTLKLAAVLGHGSASNSKASGPRALPKTKRKELKDEIKLASRLSGVSTASMGKFDKALRGEKPGERVPLGKRRKYLSVTDTKAEHGQMTSIADRFLRERAEDVVDIRKAIAKHESMAREQQRADKDLLFSKAAKKKGLVKAKGDEGQAAASGEREPKGRGAGGGGRSGGKGKGGGGGGGGKAGKGGKGAKGLGVKGGGVKKGGKGKGGKRG